MSWTQTISLREELPLPFLKHLDSLSEGCVEVVVSDLLTPGEFSVMYYKNGKYHESKYFRQSQD